MGKFHGISPANSQGIHIGIPLGNPIGIPMGIPADS